jgi:hypothetical protein
MERRVGDALADLGSEVVDVTLALGEDVDQLGPPAAPEGPGDVGEPVVQGILRDSVTHWISSVVSDRSTWNSPLATIQASL